MYHVAIVEDEVSFSTQLQEYLKKYEEENDIRFKISVFEADRWATERQMT